MRVAPQVELSPEQKAILEEQSRGRSLPAMVVERSRIVLLAASGKQDKDIAAALGISDQKSHRWRTQSISQAVVSRVIHLTTKTKPANATQWSTCMMAEEVGISEASERRIWHNNGLKPHLVETFKVSSDPCSPRNSTPSSRR